MALRVRGFVTTGAAIAACMLIAACTPEPPPVVNTPTPTASTPTASPTPTESEIERQMRLDYEAAESGLPGEPWQRANDSAGMEGSRTATPELQAVATGDYLTLQVKALRIAARRADGISMGQCTDSRRTARRGLEGDRTHAPMPCEDNSTWKIIDKRWSRRDAQESSLTTFSP